MKGWGYFDKGDPLSRARISPPSIKTSPGLDAVQGVQANKIVGILQELAFARFRFHLRLWKTPRFPAVICAGMILVKLEFERTVCQDKN